MSRPGRIFWVTLSFASYKKMILTAAKMHRLSNKIKDKG